MAHNINSLNELPFHDLNLDELLKEMGSWVYSSVNQLLDKKDLFKDTIESPNGEIAITSITLSLSTTQLNKLVCTLMRLGRKMDFPFFIAICVA